MIFLNLLGSMYPTTYIGNNEAIWNLKKKIKNQSEKYVENRHFTIQKQRKRKRSDIFINDP